MKNLVSTPDFMSSLAIYLRFCRESRKLSQNELSSLINVGVRTCQRIESGESSPSIDLLHKISKVLKIDLSEIMVDQRPEELISKFHFNILSNDILFSVSENTLFNHFINILKIQSDTSDELSLDTIAELDLFANNDLNLAISDTRWTYLNLNSRKFFNYQDQKLISCLNQKK